MPLLLVGTAHTFSLPSFLSFGSGSSNSVEVEETIPLHPNSPAEADPHTLRLKRQAYQIYIDDQPTLTVDPAEGQRESGPWGGWTEGRACSRTCGGGVAMEKRECT